LAQSFADFELIISDNASTDDTEAICRDYAARDSRIRYHRARANVGAAGNFNRVFHYARGEYFKWAASDDICLPTHLQRCVEVLDRDPGVAWCHSRSTHIGRDGEVIGDADLMDVIACYPDFASIRRTNEHFALTRTQNLIQGGDYCDTCFHDERGLSAIIHPGREVFEALESPS